MKKYELLKEGNDWQLYFFDNEFKEWHYIRTYKESDTIKKVYEDIKETYKDTTQEETTILIKYNLNK